MLKLKEYTQVKVLLWQQLGNGQSESFNNLNNEKNTDTQRQITQAKSFNKFPPGASGNKSKNLKTGRNAGLQYFKTLVDKIALRYLYRMYQVVRGLRVISKGSQKTPY